MVIVDSCVWITSLRREGDLFVKCAVEGLLDEYAATLCSPVRLEVMGGARKQERKQLSGYFSVLPYLQSRDDDWSTACAHAWRLSDKGVRVPWNDLLIATIAMRVGCRVYSLDNHFALMKEHLGLSLYEPGYGGAYVAES